MKYRQSAIVLLRKGKKKHKYSFCRFIEIFTVRSLPDN
jgi:hypothetical protein